MAYFSKETVIAAYNYLSNLTDDPSAQGATQATSALRYLFALDEYFTKYSKNCSTKTKSDKDEFIKFVGNVVAINKTYYTANFFTAIKDNSDYAVGSNFFSVNTVKTSLENPSGEYPFPKRGNSPLFAVADGELIRKPSLFKNVNSILHNDGLRRAFAIWLLRARAINKDSLFDSIKKELLKSYSAELVDSFLPNKSSFEKELAISFSNTPCKLELSDFPKKMPNKQSPMMLPTDDLIDKVRESFTRFIHLINSHTNDYSGYIANFEKFINPHISSVYPQYKSIFQIVNIDVLRSVIAKLQETEPELEKVFAKEYHGTQYASFRCINYYQNYLYILAFSDFRSYISQQNKDVIPVATSSVVKELHTHILAMRTKPFLLLAGISGTGKSRIVKQMAFESCPDKDDLRHDPTSPGNYELIEVKPNWHDSSELLGYESEIGGPHYVVTPFVRFLVKAMRYPDVPFFVCMDEMNLAPVEQYFAEFLSVLESRKLLSDGTITSEPLIKADIFSKYADQLHRDLDITDTETYKTVYDRLKNDGLRLPSNLIVVGTVNMDETTHQFSRKVIDRAMTIEMNIEDAETPFKNFFEGGDALHYYDNPQPKELFLPKVVQASEALSILSAEDASYLKENVPGLLHSLNSALNGTPFKIAYRVQNELILYFFSLREENPDEAAEALLAQAMDAILMMKVLPRIEGDEDLLDKPLKALAQFTENYPQASRKIAEMQERLPQAHFTSFWP